MSKKEGKPTGQSGTIKRQPGKRVKKDTKEMRDWFVESLVDKIFIRQTCIHCGISRDTYYRWREKHDDFAKQCDKVLDSNIEELLDYTESRLVKNIELLKESSIFFFLKTKGVHRGYAQKDSPDDDKKSVHNYFLGSVAERTNEIIQSITKGEK